MKSQRAIYPPASKSEAKGVFRNAPSDGQWNRHFWGRRAFLGSVVVQFPPLTLIQSLTEKHCRL